MYQNPYEQLYIYYFEGIPDVSKQIEAESHYLGVWEDDDVSFVFFSENAARKIELICVENPGVRLIDTYEMTGEQWHGDRIEPYHIHELCIMPPWNRPDPEVDDEKQILLDPGVVFGTGRHQTTEDCLYLMHHLFRKKKIQSVLDIGTGTGLLSLGAVALGCPRVLACDFNLLAVKTTLNNIQLNCFEEQILAFQARGEDVISLPCDLMVANIHYDVMRHLIETPYLLEKPYFILSGLLNTEAGKILHSLKQKPVHIMQHHCPDGTWNTILGMSRT